jgi:hypothetical protein
MLSGCMVFGLGTLVLVVFSIGVSQRPRPKTKGQVFMSNN